LDEASLVDQGRLGQFDEVGRDPFVESQGMRMIKTQEGLRPTGGELADSPMQAPLVKLDEVLAPRSTHVGSIPGDPKVAVTDLTEEQTEPLLSRPPADALQDVSTDVG
jgi:hypothetical protein